MTAATEHLLRCEEKGLPTTDEEFARRVADAAAHQHHQPSRHQLYSPASQLLKWGEIQKPRHSEPQDLFNDLIMVAACSQIGHFGKANHSRVGFVGFVAFGFAALSIWQGLLLYRARFEASSLAHAALDTLDALFFAAAAHNMVSELDSFEADHAFLLVGFVIASRLVQVVRMVEILLVSEASQAHAGQRGAARAHLHKVLVEIAILAPALWLTRAEVVLSILVCSTTVGVCWNFKSFCTSVDLKSSRVPMHIEYTLGRMGELVLLALGEAVVSLVLAQTGPAAASSGSAHPAAHARSAAPAGLLTPPAAIDLSDSVRAGCSFGLSFLLLSSICLIYHHANPTHRHRHASRRSALRGLLWNLMHWPLVLALISVASSLKELMLSAPAHAVPESVARSFALSLAVALSMLTAQELIHPGLAYFREPLCRVQRLTMLGGRVALCASLGALPWLAAGSSFDMLLFASAVTCAIGVVLSKSKASAAERQLWLFADAELAGVPAGPSPPAIAAQSS